MTADAHTPYVNPPRYDGLSVTPNHVARGPQHPKDSPVIHVPGEHGDDVSPWRRTWRLFATNRDVFWWQVLATVIVAAYVGSLIVLHRPISGYNSLWDGWVGNVASIVPLIPVLLRVRRPTTSRAAWIILAVGIVLYNVANLIYLLHDQNLSPIPSPALSDVPYLLSYVAFVVAVVLMTQHHFGRTLHSLQLDGAVAGLSLAALAALFWFNHVLVAGGPTLQLLVRMAYPLLDLVLLVVLVSGLASSRYRPHLATLLMMAGFVFFVVGDVVYLNQQVSGTYRPGTLLDGTWVIALWLIGTAASAPEDRRAANRSSTSALPDSVAAVPILFALVAVATLAVAVVERSSNAAAFFAIGALCVVVLRMALTLRQVKNVEQATYVVSRVDELTNLANRRSFIEGTDELLASLTDSRQMGMILIDLDGFKEINDSLGHGCGDDLLRVVGRRFARKVGTRATIARIGGDEFACAMVFDHFDDLVELGNAFESALVDPISLDGVLVRVSVSIGIAIYPEHGVTQVELMRSADVAMYEAKRHHSSICLYHADFDFNSRERLAMIADLRAAIDLDQLVLHFQLTQDFHSGEIHGVEALVRWNHPTRGLIYPDDFIPIAERVGLIVPLTRVVLRKALSEMVRLDSTGHRLNMSVNISHLDLVDEKLPNYVTMLLMEFGVDSERLTLEVTESSLGEDSIRTRRSIEQLRALGVRISIDDFGVGYSSMSQLLELPIDELKIDKTFVFALESDVRARAVISSTIELGRALNVTVVAEGIETFSNHEMLRALGADIAQGYYIARPKTSEEVDEYLALPASLH
ncbi:MAG TPA: EAL domain-containing protein [Acidimicrobiales bacterium]